MSNIFQLKTLFLFVNLLVPFLVNSIKIFFTLFASNLLHLNCFDLISIVYLCYKQEFLMPAGDEEGEESADVFRFL